MTNATKLLEDLNPEEIRRRLDELEREERALGVLLRAATRLGRQPTQNRPKPEKGAK
jgi:hypothetical protein